MPKGLSTLITFLHSTKFPLKKEDVHAKSKEESPSVMVRSEFLNFPEKFWKINEKGYSCFLVPYLVYQRENEGNARVYRGLKILLLRKSVVSKQPQID